MNNILEQIIATKRRTVEIQKAKKNTNKPSIKRDCSVMSNFKTALQKCRDIGIIAEVKKASPSKGIICDDFDPVRLATEYADAGADCLSVLTEEDFFLGSPEHLINTRQGISLPILRKDFIIDEWQIYDSQNIGANAILLIVAALDHSMLKDFHQLAKALNLDVLVEIHDQRELEIAISIDAEIIGINNRNLKDFQTDIATTKLLAKLIPDDILIVSESGITTRSDVNYVAQAGAKAILVGESLLRAKSISKKIAFLKGDALSED